MVQRWITTRLMTFLVTFLKGQGSKVTELCQKLAKNCPQSDNFQNVSKSNDAIPTKHGAKMDHYLGVDCMTFLVKFLKGQRSKVNELCQNWLKIAPK